MLTVSTIAMSNYYYCFPPGRYAVWSLKTAVFHNHPILASTGSAGDKM